MSFINDDFILHSETARRLYHGHAEGLPIIDYHCHIDPREICENRRFENITQVWLGGDHYKWRLLRNAGVPEYEITGGADDLTKFRRFAQILPKAVGNPMFAWCHLELKRYFGYDGILSAATADEVWELCGEKLKGDGLTACGIIERSNVKLIGTTDDPADTLEWHEKIAGSGCCTALVVPSFRPDRALNIDKPGFADYLRRLGEAAGTEITSVGGLKKALSARLERFCALGCRAADHGLDYIPFAECGEREAEAIFEAAVSGKPISAADADRYKTHMLLYLAGEYARRGVVMQLHYNVQRSVNRRQLGLLGADTGFDCIASHDCGQALTALLDAMDGAEALPKTVLYSLNPQDNALLDSIAGCFTGEGVRGKVQHGAAWWFNDTKGGMEEQLRSLASRSLLGNFIGMLTDSRSFLSYTRHEYFRRILCDILGGWAESGEYPADPDTLGGIAEDICCSNAAEFFGV